MTDENGRRSSRSLVQLIADLPTLVINLLKAELDQLKAELASKAKHAGVGIGLFVAAAILMFFAVGVLIATAILALALVLPAWLSALIIGVALIVIAGILALIGRSAIKRIGSLAPERTIASLRDDAEAIKGIGKYDR